MQNLQTLYAHQIRNKCIKSKDNERTTIRRSRISVVQSGVTKLNGLYIPVGQ